MIGNIQLFQKIGVSGDRTVYRFLNDDVIKKVSIPTEKEDAFEKMNQEMQDNFNDFVYDKNILENFK